jgi:hypothetical protein
MHTTTQQPGKDAEHEGGHMTEESDIGSGEKTPAERETDEQIKTITPKPQPGAAAPP